MMVAIWTSFSSDGSPPRCIKDSHQGEGEGEGEGEAVDERVRLVAEAEGKGSW